jgi:hypothetical protein
MCSDKLKMLFNCAKNCQRILQENPKTIGAYFKLVEDTKAERSQAKDSKKANIEQGEFDEDLTK